MTRNRSSTHVPLAVLAALSKLQKEFSKTTGLELLIQYIDGSEFNPASENHGFCQLIQSTQQGVKTCLLCGREAMQRAIAKGDYHIYTCQYGMVNAVIPLIYRGRQIGVIFTGQVFTDLPAPHEYSRLIGMAKDAGISREQARTEIHKVRIIDRETLLMGVRLLRLITNHILKVYEGPDAFNDEVDDDFSFQDFNHAEHFQNSLQRLGQLILNEETAAEYDDIMSLATQSEQQVINVTQAISFIKEHFRSPLQLGEVACVINLSPNYFSTVFKEITGSNFSDYLNSLRMQEAKALLRDTKLPIKQIVEEVGFMDYNYFNKVFKKMIGVPPATYREVFGKEKSQEHS